MMAKNTVCMLLLSTAAYTLAILPVWAESNITEFRLATFNAALLPATFPEIEERTKLLAEEVNAHVLDCHVHLYMPKVGRVL